MKRLLSFVMMLALLLSLGAAAFADIANEHIDDFYWRNTGKFDYSGRGFFYVDSADGYVTAWTSPAALKFVENIPNGRVLYIQATYNGWATATYLADGKYVDGNEWIPLDCLTPKYTGEDFSKEYGSRIDRTGTSADYFEDYSLINCLCFYSFPGSGELCGTIEELYEDEPLELEALFVDDTGKSWAYCSGYTYLNINGWIRLDAPENGALPVTLDKRPELKSPAADVSDVSLEHNRYDYIISGGIYAAVASAGIAVIASAVLIYINRRKRIKEHTA